MEIDVGPSLFGSRTRTSILLVLQILGESYAREISRLLGAHLSNVQRALDSLEQVGVISGVMRGRTRVVSLNPRYFAREELGALLEKLAFSDAPLVEMVSEFRRRPRRSGKGL